MMNAPCGRIHDQDTPHPAFPHKGGRGKKLEQGTAKVGKEMLHTCRRASLSTCRSRARTLRLNMTPPERILWKGLRDLNRLEKARFRRQAAIGPYVVDFVSFRHGLVIEVDGETHAGEGAARRDAKRDAFLVGEGV